MISTITFCILKQAITTIGVYTRIYFKFLWTNRKTISIYKITARIVRRINIDHLDFTKVAFL